MRNTLVVLVFVLLGCSNLKDELTDVFYYPSGNMVMYKKTFCSEQDKHDGNYTQIEYDSLGNIKRIFNVRNNELNGKLIEYYSNGNIRDVNSFNNGIEHGISKYFNADGFLITEELVINGRSVIWKNFVRFHKILSYGYEIKPLRNDTAFRLEGQIIYDSNMRIIDSATFYFDVVSSKITSNKDSVFFEIKTIGTAFNGYNYNIVLYLGELNTNDLKEGRYSLIDTLNIFRTENRKNLLTASCRIKPEENNLITGILMLELYSADDTEIYGLKYYTFYQEIDLMSETLAQK